jgi:MYXO-CTERM domain-containing protein
VAIDPGSPRTLYVGLSGGVGGLWRSRDDGVSWTAVRPSVGDVFGVVVNPETHAVYCVAAAGVSKSADQGATWESYTFDLLSVFQCRLAVGTAPHELYLGSYGLGLLALGGGLVSSPDGGALDGGAPGPGESIVVGTCGCSEGPHAGVLFSVAAVALLALRRRRQFS